MDDSDSNITLELNNGEKIILSDDLTLKDFLYLEENEDKNKEYVIRELLNNLLINKNSIEKFTDKDIEKIFLYYLNEYNLYDFYNNNIDKGKTIYEAIYLSLRKCCSDRSEKLFKNLNKMTNIPEIVIRPTILELQECIKSISLPSITLANTLNQALLSWQNNANLISSLLKEFSSSYIINMNTAISMIKSISDSANLVIDNIKNVYNIIPESIKSINTNIAIFSEANNLIIESRNIVVSTNEYFLKSFDYKRDDVENEIIRDNNFTEVNNKILNDKKRSEEILIYHASKSIIDINNLSLYIKSKFEKIEDDIREIKDVKNEYKDLFSRFNILSKRMSFKDLLEIFASEITKCHKNVFWVDGKYRSNPESIAKMSLGLFLKGHYKDITFIGPEINCSDGYLDLIVNFLGINYIIELKMLGESWSYSWAKSGIEQLNIYMRDFNENESYLVIFDGRKTERGQKFENEYTVEYGTVHVIVVRI